MRIWNKSAAAGGVAHPFEQVEPGHERRVCSCKTAEWRWVDAGTPSDKDKCRGGLILEREEARRERDEYRDLAQTRAEVGRRALQERDEAREEVARLRAIRHDAADAAGLRRLCEDRGPESIIVCPIGAVRELIACRSCKDSGIVRRLGWDGTPDEDWCDCPAGDAYKAEVENRPPATTF